MESNKPSTGGLGDASTSDSAEVLARALELRENGHADWLEQATAECPQLRDEVSAAVERALLLPSMLADGVIADALVGTTLAGRYEVQRRVGAGAMGVVYEARDVELKRRVAIKVLRAGMMEHERAVARFEREAQAMAAVDHPSVIAIHDRGRTARDEAFIVMEFVDGVQLGTLIDDLAERFEGGRPVEPGVLSTQLGIDDQGEPNYLRLAVGWVADLAAAIQQTHDAGVVHRDIKPSNILIRRDGRPVLLDFGVALLEDATTLTHAGSGVGTPAYMPPEALERERRTTEAGDVYSLAAVLYCLISLRPPYKGTPTQVLASLATREPEPLEKLRRDVPRDLQAIVEQGMARRPGQRYADASELEADLRAFLEHRPVKARPTGPLRRSMRRMRDSRSVRGATAALLLVLLVSVGVSVRNSIVDGWEKQAQAEYDQRSARTQELYLRFPPNLGIIEFQNRRIHRESDRLAFEALLDEAVETCVDPYPVVLLRAVHRHDHGDVRGAERDMVRIALHEGTELATAIASAYQALPDDSDSSRDLELAGLPEPATDRDRYLLGFLHLRNWEDAAGKALLEGGGSDAVPHGQEILWPLVEFSGKNPEQIRVLGEQMLGELLLHEEQNGGVSASTAHFRSHIYGRMGAHTEGYRWGLKSVELSPWTHVNRGNVGYNAMLLGRHEEAEQVYLHGLEQQPGYHRLADNYLWCLIAQGRFDFALSETERLAESERLDEGWAFNRVAGVEAYRALSTWLDLRADAEPDEAALRDLVRAVEAARAALKAYESSGSADKPTTSFAFLDALQTGDELSLFEALAEHAKRSRYQPWALNQVLDVFPEALPEGSGLLARELLADVVQRLNLSRTGFFNRDVDR